MGIMFCDWILLLPLISNSVWEVFGITNRRHINHETSVRNFRHIGTSSAIQNDWEPGLREATIQALHREHKSDPNLRKLIQDAPLLGKQDKATPFGDIAVLARGQLYSNFGGYVYVQDPYQNDCDDCHNINTRCGRIHCEIWKPRSNEQLTALWSIKRIRHREFNGNHRYEVEYTISPINSLTNQPFVTKEGRFDYAIPGHVFILRNGHMNIPQNHNSFDYKPGTLIIDGNKHHHNFQTSQKYPTTTDDKDLDIYKILLDTLNKKTTTTNLNSASSTTVRFSTKPTPSSTTTLLTEVPKTTLVELPTGQLVPITHITTPFISETTPGFVAVRFPSTPSTTSLPKTTKETSKSTTPMKIKTTFHYFSAIEEEGTTEAVPKTTVALKPSTYAENTMFIMLEDAASTHSATHSPPQVPTVFKTTSTSTTPFSTSLASKTTLKVSTEKTSVTVKPTKSVRTTKKRYTRVKNTTKKVRPTVPMRRTTTTTQSVTETPIITIKLTEETTRPNTTTTISGYRKTSPKNVTEEPTVSKTDALTETTEKTSSTKDQTSAESFSDTFLTSLVNETPATTQAETQPKTSMTLTTKSLENILTTGTQTTNRPSTEPTYTEPETVLTTKTLSTSPVEGINNMKPSTVYYTKTTTKPSSTMSDFLEDEDYENSRKGIYPLNSKIDVSDDDIFGTALQTSTKPTPINKSKVKKVTKSDVELALFGSGNSRNSKSLKRKPNQETTLINTEMPKIIYSNFYEPSTNPMTTNTASTKIFTNNIGTTRITPVKIETTPKIGAITSQSYLTSISFEVSKRNGSNEKTEKGPEQIKKNVGGNNDNDPKHKESFDHLAMMVLNHARSIDYLSKATKPSTTKYKRRRNYTPRYKKVAKKSKSVEKSK